MAVSVDIKSLLASGLHFGHKTSRWHPKMAPYIHSKRQDNHIIDLTKTAEGLERALAFITEVVASGKQVLLVGTKRQAKDLIKSTAEKTKQPYVSERWLGGTLTNAATVGSQIKHLKMLESRMISGELTNRYSKLEVQRFQEEIEALNLKYGGIKDMNGNPGAVFVTDVINDANAIAEARRLHIPVIGIVDSNADPGLVDYVIPANDDAIKGIELILEYVSQAITEGSAKLGASKKSEEPKSAKEVSGE